jgi:hypothetical protein
MVNAERRGFATAKLQPISGVMISFLNIMKHRGTNPTLCPPTPITPLLRKTSLFAPRTTSLSPLTPKKSARVASLEHMTIRCADTCSEMDRVYGDIICLHSVSAKCVNPRTGVWKMKYVITAVVCV